MRTSARRTLAIFLSLSLSAASFAEPPVPEPKVIKLKAGGYLYNDAAHLVLDAEMRRLQNVELIHKNESWFSIVAVSAGVGFLLGIALSVTVWYLLK